MNLPHPKLRLPMILLFASLAIGSGLFQLSLNHRLASERRYIFEHSQAEAMARTVRETPARLLQDQAEAGLFQHIRNSGFINPENRINWISALAKTQNQLNLDSLSWRIAAQTTSDLAPDLYVSNMEITASPIDAASLAQLLVRLQQNAHGRFTVEYCNLAFDTHTQPGQADCGLSWWTLEQTAD